MRFMLVVLAALTAAPVLAAPGKYVPVPDKSVLVQYQEENCRPCPPRPTEPPRYDVPKFEKPVAPVEKPFNWNLLYIVVGLLAFVGTVVGALVGGYFTNESED